MVEYIEEIDLASEVKEFVAQSPDVTFSNEKHKKTVLQSEDWELLKVTKVIESPTKIINVEVVNDSFLKKNF